MSGDLLLVDLTISASVPMCLNALRYMLLEGCASLCWYLSHLQLSDHKSLESTSNLLLLFQNERMECVATTIILAWQHVV